MLKRKASILAAALLLTGLLAGCNEDKKDQQTAEQAFLKQSEMNQYAFQGSVTLDVPYTPSPTDNAISASLASLIGHSEMTFKGVSAKNPAAFETTLTIKPSGMNQSYDVPVIIKENKLYASVPLLNQKDEYLAVDLAKLSETSGRANPFAGDGASALSTAVGGALSRWSKAIDASLFSKSKDSTAQATTIRITLDGKKGASAIAEWSKAWSAAADELKGKSLLTDAQMGLWNGVFGAGGTAELAKPGYVELTTNEQGFITKLDVDLALNAAGADGKTSAKQIKWHMEYSSINQNPPFTMETPTKLLQFEDLLKKLAPQQPKS